MNNRLRRNVLILTGLLFLSIGLNAITMVQVEKLEDRVQAQQEIVESITEQHGQIIDMVENSLLMQDQLADELIEMKTRMAETIR